MRSPLSLIPRDNLSLLNVGAAVALAGPCGDGGEKPSSRLDIRREEGYPQGVHQHPSDELDRRAGIPVKTGVSYRTGVVCVRVDAWRQASRQSVYQIYDRQLACRVGSLTFPG